jgi:hypothetical protein
MQQCSLSPLLGKSSHFAGVAPERFPMVNPPLITFAASPACLPHCSPRPLHPSPLTCVRARASLSRHSFPSPCAVVATAVCLSCPPVNLAPPLFLCPLAGAHTRRLPRRRRCEAASPEARESSSCGASLSQLLPAKTRPPAACKRRLPRDGVDANGGRSCRRRTRVKQPRCWCPRFTVRNPLSFLLQIGGPVAAGGKAPPPAKPAAVSARAAPASREMPPVVLTGAVAQRVNGFLCVFPVH